MLQSDDTCTQVEWDVDAKKCVHTHFPSSGMAFHLTCSLFLAPDAEAQKKLQEAAKYDQLDCKVAFTFFTDLKLLFDSTVSFCGRTMRYQFFCNYEVKHDFHNT